ncbi:hypothetical protein [Nocardia stercoris]|uniref:4Fe-4S Wbl-type domain-containing protein n=1 Tax=Nocardia stercoris TaxID=2483361 RepID=A0A3M2L5W7_9NOCA|nr:hypothetical protein [Nocardia stercoris]RMI32957.1 hypothetical protein EBN03_13720 [Nocardia stercoris]
MNITRISAIGSTSTESATGATGSAKSVRPPCADAPHDWDLDVGTPESWRTAVATCAACPLLVGCAELARQLIADSDAPRAMIWAGIAYDAAGRVVEDLDRVRVAPIDHKRPIRIIRTGERQVCAAPVAAAPRRHFVLGRPLAPTGTDGF